MRRIRAEPFCRIKWIRRHDTFSSYRLRRKLHDLFSYAAGNAASYTLASFRQDSAWLAGRRIPTGRARKSRNEISVACNVIMSVQYVILYYIVGPTCRGLNGQVRAPLRYKREALAAHFRLSRARRETRQDSHNTSSVSRRTILVSTS
jgi:hypothetical protein